MRVPKYGSALRTASMYAVSHLDHHAKSIATDAPGVACLVADVFVIHLLTQLFFLFPVLRPQPFRLDRLLLDLLGAQPGRWEAGNLFDAVPELLIVHGVLEGFLVHAE